MRPVQHLDADVVVVGGGLSGLVTAYRLHGRGFDVEVLEKSERVGGVIGSRRQHGALVETGPNTALDATPLIGALLADLGIADQRRDANAAAATRFIVRDDCLVPLPASPAALVTTRAFTLRAKLRLLAEPFIAASGSDKEESVAQFARRRLGSEVLAYLIDPFVAGIYAGDPEELSLPAAFPRVYALEQTHGSLLKAALHRARERRQSSPPPAPAAASFSFVRGMQTLTDALARQLPRIGYGTKVERLARNADGTWTLLGSRAGALVMRQTGAVVLCPPASASAAIIAELAPRAAQALRAIDYAPIVSVASAYRRDEVKHPLTGFGFLVPGAERRRILGALFSSSLFDGRAADGTVLVTAFVGGRRDPDMVALPDAALRATVSEELARLVAAPVKPLWQEIVRWQQAIPQYDRGHHERLRMIERAEADLPGLRFCGSYRGGVSVGDCIVSGQATADALDRYLRAP